MKKLIIGLSLLFTPLISRAASLQYIPSTSTFFNYRTNIASATLHNFTVQSATAGWIHASSGSVDNLTISTITAPFVIISSGSANFSNLTATGATIGTMTVTGETVTASTITNLNSSIGVINGLTVTESTFTRAIIGISTITTGTIQNANFGNSFTTGTWTWIGSTITHSGSVSNGTQVINSTISYTGQNNFRNGISISTLSGTSSMFVVGQSSVSIIGAADGNEISSGLIASTVTASTARSTVVFPSGTTSKNICTFLLPAGNWYVTVHVNFSVISGNPASTQLRYGVDTSSGAAVSVLDVPTSQGKIGGEVYAKALATIADDDITGDLYTRIRLTTPTNIFFNVTTITASGVVGVGGYMTAIRF